MTRRALVTGAAGFVGQWLCRTLLEEGWDVVGAGVAAHPGRWLLDERERSGVRWVLADVRLQSDVARIVDESRPDAIFHLAGVSFVPDAQGDPVLAHEVNILGAARVLNEVRVRRRRGEIDPVVLVIGSAEQYGAAAGPHPIGESTPQQPVTVYAASKAAQEIVALEPARRDGVRVVATRSFNHSGPGHGDNFLLPALVKRAFSIERGESPPVLRIGNPETVRDFLHVRDVVRAYLLLAEKGATGEVYNVCSGIGSRVRELAGKVLRGVGVRATVEVDPTLVRPTDVVALVGDNGKLRAATGWRPELTCDDIIADLIHAASH